MSKIGKLKTSSPSLLFQNTEIELPSLQSHKPNKLPFFLIKKLKNMEENTQRI
jgi:hypothetical protein